MKIDFFISSLSGGGAERVLVTIAKKFAEQGDDVSVVSLEKRPQFYKVDSKVALKRFNNVGKSFSSLRDLLCIRKFIKQRKADACISFLSRCNLIVLFASLFTKNKIIVCDRNNPQREHSALVFWLTGWLYRRANVINVQTEQVKSFYPRSLQKKIMVIENPLDVDHLKRQVLEMPKREKIILSMGRLENQKDFETLIIAFEKISKDVPDWNVNIFGLGDNRQRLQKLIDSKGLRDRVFLKGRTETPFYEMCRSSVFVLSSFYEGFPNVLCEAMHAGCLCISSDCDCGPRDLLKQGENGWLFPVQDVNTLAELIKNSIEKIDQLDHIRTAAQETVKRLYVESITQKWKLMIQNMVGV